MSKLVIPEPILGKHIAVVGMTGSGKTNTEKVVVETVVPKGARVCILDTVKSDHWGLTSNHSGNGPGLPFQILGGPHGHVPLHAGAGAAIAELVATGKLPLSIIDMSDFGPGGLQRFFNDFAPVLLKKMRGVLYLLIEEAHEVCPKEKTGAVGENMAVYHAKKLATAGRSKGLRLIVATQRVQALHNAVLSSCETVIVHRMTYPADQEPVVRWLKGSVKDKAIREQIEESMPELADGEAWVCSGSAKILQRMQMPRIWTFDNSATPDDDSAADAVVTAKVDQEKLRALIGDAVKDAEASDPAILKKRIAELERQLKTGGTRTADDVAAARTDGERVGFDKGVRQGYRAGWDAHICAVSDALRAIPPDPPDVGARPENPERRVEGRRPAEAFQERRTGTAPSLPRARQIDGRAPARLNGHGETLPKGEAATLAACIQFPDGLRREQLTVLTGYKRSSRDAYIQRLREKGYVDTSGEVIRATAEGCAALPDAEPLPTGKDLQDYWLQRLPEGERKILDVLIQLHGEPIARADLDGMTGYQRSSRDSYLQRLRAKQLVVDEGRSQVRATENLFT